MKKVFKRFIDVWKPSFFHELSTTEKTLKTTIGFWVLTNFLYSVAITAVFVVFALIFKVGLPEIIDDFTNKNEIRDDMGVTMTDGELSVQNIDEPVIYSEEENGTSILFVLDTKSDDYTLDDLEKNDSGAIILKNKMYFKGNDKVRLVDFKEDEIKDFSLTFGDAKNIIFENIDKFIFILAIVIFVSVLLWFSVFRLLTALWWALILWILSMIFGSEKSYGKSYEAVLNFYFIPLVIETILFFTGLSFGFSTLVIFSIIFVVNLIWIKNNVEKREIAI